ncbi:MAG: DUF4870 domain-containing protein [archaeon]
MAKKAKKEVKKATVKKPVKATTKSGDDSKLFAWLATFLSIIGFVIALLAKKDNAYVMYYAKQSLVIFILAIIVGIVNSIIVWIPFLGWFIMVLLNLVVLVLWVISWVYALSGEMKEVPVIGQYGNKINL